MPFRYCDIVRHHSQPVPMVVIKEDESGVECFWFDAETVQTGRFPSRELRLVLGSHYDGEF